MPTDTVVSPEVEVDVDLDARVVCEIYMAFVVGDTVVAKLRRCENEASWAGRYPCCGKLALLCDDHYLHPQTTFKCAPCKHTFCAQHLIGTRRL